MKLTARWPIFVVLNMLLQLLLSFQSVFSFQCLAESERKTITFANNQGVAVPGLWKVRIMQGSYGSQYAMEYAAYLFMKEMLGIDVTFYPTHDASLGWSYQANNPDNDPEDKGYPENYFAWLARDVNDLNFEFWPAQAESGESYYLSGSVDFGGFVGAYGEISWWIPKYFVEEHPTVLVPSVLKSDSSIREALINGSADYVAIYNQSDSFSFDKPDMTKPTVWGSYASYKQSQTCFDLTRNIEGGMNISFTPTGSEGALAALVKDLYSRRLPFLANIYTVDDSFAIWDDINNELQQFEKVAFPRNPDQSVNDPCFVGGLCQYPVQPIMKAANPKLKERFPEAHDFFAGFTITTTQVNKLISYYISLEDAGLSPTERWLNASCSWLKDPDSASTWNTSAWLVDIVRYDCLNGCGINGVGGVCDYYTGKCICTYPELFAEFDCKQSCDGLLGPYLNESNILVFDFCSGNGVCDTFTKSCKCRLGFGGSGCETKYELYYYLTGLQITIIGVSCILSVICIASIFWLRMNAQYKTVKALSVDMTTLMTLGLLMITCSNIALVIPVNDFSCVAWQWLFGLGGILSIMSPLLKAYRVSRVFHGGKMLKAVKITDAMLMSTLIKVSLVEVIVCAAFTFAHQYYGGIQKYYNDNELRIENQCNLSTITNYLSLVSYAYFFVMLCSLTYYSYGTRRALSVFKESSCAYFSSFLSLFCTIITFVFYMATNDPTFRLSVQATAIIIVVSAVLGLFYLTRIYFFFLEPENRNVTDSAHVPQKSNSTASFSNSVIKPGPQEGKK
jgi:ABC-type proline/glycine betaine transport system substrate-binding protein